RSFDLDHYDWPATARDSLVGAGVNFVGDGELTRLLIASGLRIKLRDRPAARARRSAEHAAALGLEPVPRDLVVGLRGHVDPLPEDAGAFRLTRDEPEGPARIEAHDAPGRRSARARRARLDALARARTGSVFVGPVMDAPRRWARRSARRARPGVLLRRRLVGGAVPDRPALIGLDLRLRRDLGALQLDPE